MPPAPLPGNEPERLAALRSYDVLDTSCEKVFDDIARLAARLTGRPIALVSLIDSDRQWFKAHHGLAIRETPRDMAFCAHAILTPEAPMVVPDATLDPRFVDNPLVYEATPVRSYVGVPLTNPEGHALGTLCVIDREPRETSPEQLEVLGSLANAVSTALELRRAMLRLRDQTLTDGLTGLPNRSALIAAVDQAIHRQRALGESFSLLFCDLDGFKRVNDQLGHATGDRVLCVVAEVLRGSIRQRDLVARLGGDEFCAVLEDTESTGMLAERLRATLEARMAAQGWPVTASIGAVTFPEPPASASAAVDLADRHMYAAKAAGKNRVTLAAATAAA